MKRSWDDMEYGRSLWSLEVALPPGKQKSSSEIVSGKRSPGEGVQSMVLEQNLRDICGLQLMSHLGSLGSTWPPIMQSGV